MIMQQSLRYERMTKMQLKDNTILAVPCNRLVIFSREQGEKIIAEHSSKRKFKEEKEQLAQDVKALFAKPDSK